VGAAILVASWAVAAWHWRDRRQRLLVLLVAVQFAFAEFSPNKQLRFMAVILPALGLLAGHWIVEAVRRWAQRYTQLPLVVGAALALTFVAHEGALIRDVRPLTDKTADAALEWVDAQLREKGPALVLSSGEASIRSRLCLTGIWPPNRD